MASNHFITTPIYYVNDQPHIGHAYTTVAADVLARAHRILNGNDKVFFLTGTDEHGTKVAQRAEELGKEPKMFTDAVAAQFKNAWEELDIQYDHFIRTTDPVHIVLVKKILEQLKSTKTPAGNDCIYEGMYKGFYCVGCEKYLTKKDIVDGVCSIHKKPPQEIEEKNWFFRLSDYLPLVKEKIKMGELTIYPEERENETLGLFEQGLEDFSISRSTVTWGIPIPWDESQSAYVWVDALSNYITAIGFPDNKEFVQKWWRDGNVTHLMAMDILRFHAVYWPALLLALDLPVPNHLYIHGFFTIDGEKMSKSAGNAISPHDLVKRFGSDATRYLLLSQFSFGYESDIKAQDFVTKYNADCANGLGNLVSRVTNMIEKYRKESFEFVPMLDKNFQDEVVYYIRQLRFREGLRVIWKRIADANQYIDTQKPWTLAEIDVKRLDSILHKLLQDIYNIGQALRPFMPRTADRIQIIVQSKSIVKVSDLFDRIDV